jgi:nucleoside-diphosphate-sugar epimerase
MTIQKILITGVNGLIGSLVYERLSVLTDIYDVYGADRSTKHSDRVSGASAHKVPADRFFEVDLADRMRVQKICEGMHMVVHLAANPDPGASWDSLLHNNIEATYHVFEACRLSGVRRVVYASSGQAILGYRHQEPYKGVAEGYCHNRPLPQVTYDMPTKPINVYGCTKVWGEALARTYADAHGLSCLCIRFGWVLAKDALPYPNQRDVWCSGRDAVQMVERCLAAPDFLRYDIFQAFSKSPYLWKDISHAQAVLGYDPQDDVMQFENKK